MSVTKVVLAKLSPTMEEGTIVKWSKNEGDPVKVGDVLAEIETDKANMEMEALGSGVLRKVLVPAGGKAPVGALIGVIAEPGEDISAMLATAAPAAGSRSGPGRRGSASACRHRARNPARSNAALPRTRGACGRCPFRSPTSSRRSSSACRRARTDERCAGRCARSRSALGRRSRRRRPRKGQPPGPGHGGERERAPARGSGVRARRPRREAGHRGLPGCSAAPAPAPATQASPAEPSLQASLSSPLPRPHRPWPPAACPPPRPAR